MGTVFRIVLYVDGQDKAEIAFRQAFNRIREIDDVFSDYNPESEVSKLSALSSDDPNDSKHPISDDLLFVLTRALEFSAATDGAFDVTVGPLSRLWRRSARQGELPSDKRLSEALSSVGWGRLDLDQEGHTLRLLARNMRLDFGGIAKGYALDQAQEVIAQLGIVSSLIDGGGDIVARGSPPDSDGWRVRIEATGDSESEGVYIKLCNAAVATSGDRFQSVEIDGRRYSHIVDMKRGLGLDRQISATAIAKNGMDADATATILCLLGPNAARLWVESHPQVQARWIAQLGDSWTAEYSAGFEDFLVPQPSGLQGSTPSQDNAFERNEAHTAGSFSPIAPKENFE